MTDMEVHYNKDNMTKAQDRIASVCNAITDINTLYSGFLSQLSKEKICCKDSPNRLFASDWPGYEGNIPNTIDKLKRCAEEIKTNFIDINSLINTNDNGEVQDTATGLMTTTISVTDPSVYTQVGTNNEIGFVDTVLNALKTILEGLGRVIATIVDACTSLLLGLGRLAEGIVDAGAMLAGGVACLTGNVEFSNQVKDWIEISWTDEFADELIYPFWDTLFAFSGRSFKDYSFLNDGGREFFQETGRWIGIAALSCIIPVSGSVVGGVLGGVSGFGIGGQEAFESDLGWDGAYLWASGRAIMDALIGKNLGGKLNGGMSGKQYIAAVKKDGFVKTTKTALSTGFHDFVSIVSYSGRHVLTSSGEKKGLQALLSYAGKAFMSPVATSLVYPAMINGAMDTAYDLSAGLIADNFSAKSGDIQEPIAPDDRGDTGSFEGNREPGGAFGSGSGDNPSGGGNYGNGGSSGGNGNYGGGGSPSGVDVGFNGGGTLEYNPAAGNSVPNDGTANAEQTQNPGVGLGDNINKNDNNNSADNLDSNNGNDNVNNAPSDGEPSNDEPNLDDNSSSSGDDSTPGTTDDPNLNDDKVNSDNPDASDKPNESPSVTNDPSHPKVTIDNKGPGSVTLQQAGAGVGAAALGAAGSQFISGGDGYIPSGNTVNTTPQYTTAPNDKKDEDDEKDKKNKYIWESMPPTVENPALDAGLLDETPANVTVEGPEPGADLQNNTQQGIDTLEEPVDSEKAEPVAEQNNVDGTENTSMNADKTNLNTILGLGGISAGLGVGGVYVAQARKDTEKENKMHNSAKKLNEMPYKTLENQSDNESQQSNNGNGFNQF